MTIDEIKSRLCYYDTRNPEGVSEDMSDLCIEQEGYIAEVINGFVWLIVTDKAKEIFSSGTFDLYVLYPDGTESEITSHQGLDHTLQNGLDIGIEVGHLKDLNA